MDGPPVVTEADDIHSLKSQIGGYVRRGNLEAADLARRDLRVVQVRVRAKALVASWPPPTPEQLRTIIDVLRPVEVG